MCGIYLEDVVAGRQADELDIALGAALDPLRIQAQQPGAVADPLRQQVAQAGKATASEQKLENNGAITQLSGG